MRAVRKMIGVENFFRISLHSSRPLTSGSPISRMIRSACDLAIKGRTGDPEARQTVSNPSVSRAYWILSVMAGSSSTIRIFAFMVSSASPSGLIARAFYTTPSVCESPLL
jgi:hypothetical protein